MKRSSEKSERLLYYSIWVVILVGLALWKLRPAPETSPADLEVTLAPEVQPWFSEGAVQRIRGNALTLGLVLRPEYRRTLRNGSSEVQVNYRVESSRGPASEGSATVRVWPDRTLGEALLTVPNRTPDTRIHLFLKR